MTDTATSLNSTLTQVPAPATVTLAGHEAPVTSADTVDPLWLHNEFAPRYLDAWNSHDADSLLALMTDDIVYRDDGWPKTMRGHADVRECVEAFWRAIPDLHFDVLDAPYIMPGQRKVVATWLATGTLRGRFDPPGWGPTGKRFEVDGVDIHEYRDGKLCRLRIVLDRMSIAEQVGVLPRPGSRGERLFAGAQRVYSGLRTRR